MIGELIVPLAASLVAVIASLIKNLVVNKSNEARPSRITITRQDGSEVTIEAKGADAQRFQELTDALIGRFDPEKKAEQPPPRQP